MNNVSTILIYLMNEVQEEEEEEVIVVASEKRCQSKKVSSDPAKPGDQTLPIIFLLVHHVATASAKKLIS